MSISGNDKRSLIVRREMSVVCALFIIAAFLASFPVHAQSTNPQKTLNQFVSGLQKSPNDCALREKIIKHVQMMRPAPAMPETAREHYVMAATFMEKAKDNRGDERGSISTDKSCCAMKHGPIVASVENERIVEMENL
jgi:hypothetical protein